MPGPRSQQWNRPNPGLMAPVSVAFPWRHPSEESGQASQHLLGQEFGVWCLSVPQQVPEFPLCDSEQAMSRETQTETKRHPCFVF